MRRILYCLLSAVMLLTVLSGCTKSTGGLDPTIGTVAKTEDGNYYYEENRIKVISQNVRHPNADSPNSTEERSTRLYTILEKYDADIIGFQEMRPWWVDMFPKLLLVDEYDHYTKYRHDSDKEGLTICWKTEKFEALDEGVFWVSDTPDEPSKYEEAKYYRITIWVKLKELTTGTEFFVFNTHFDNTAAVRVKSAQVLKEQMEEICGDTPAFIVGDFNCTDQSEEYQELVSFLRDTAAEKNDLTGTFHDYGTVPAEEQKRIDYCFLRDESIIAETYKVLDEPIDGNYCSDHHGIYMELILT
ncbi:MAG: endonuclease/exonuclease/phosphatase family protein [Clostridia bacterium]|nr:endonuclease/exonuclease/phosphatase family protein [Clostridia bacterium]